MKVALCAAIAFVILSSIPLGAIQAMTGAGATVRANAHAGTAAAQASTSSGVLNTPSAHESKLDAEAAKTEEATFSRRDTKKNAKTAGPLAAVSGASTRSKLLP
jgi:hypothetical protein